MYNIIYIYICNHVSLPLGHSNASLPRSGNRLLDFMVPPLDIPQATENKSNLAPLSCSTMKNRQDLTLHHVLKQIQPKKRHQT